MPHLVSPPSNTAISPSAPRAGGERVAVAAVVALSIAAWGGLVAEALRAGADADFVSVICRPSALLAGTDGLAGAIGQAFALWFVMSTAMMLPTSVPMVLGFVDALAGVRPAPRREALLPVALVAGYALVWAAVSLPAAVVQSLLSVAAARWALPTAALAVMSGAALGFAGLYQFSDLKQRFLAACRHPVPAMAGDQARPGPALRLGLDQGLRCLGCCAAIMGLMLLSGAMNLAWMGLAALAMTVERLSAGPWPRRVIGIVLIAAGLGMALAGVGPGRVVDALTAR